jgi:hypothetical protein
MIAASTMTSTTLRRTTLNLLALSIALAGATLAAAQTPAPPETKPGTPAAAPAASDAKSTASDAKSTASDAKPATPDAKSKARDAKPAQARPRRAPAQAEEAAPSPSPEESPLAPLAWLEGCWTSNVNKREVREHWLPLRGNLMLGMSQTVVQGKTQDYEYLRIESRPDGVYYVVLPSGQNATSFKFEGKTVVTMGDRSDDAFVFTNPTLEFPQKLVYRRATLGWLYASVVGKVAGKDKEVLYPLRRTDCETGEVIER